MKEKELLKKWLSYKLDCTSAVLDKPYEAKHEIDYRVDGFRCYGQVSLIAKPAATFSFIINCALPQEEEKELSKLILAGVLDELISNELMPLLGCSIQIEEAKWLSGESANLMYYYCARECIKKVVASGDNKAHIPGASIT